MFKRIDKETFFHFLQPRQFDPSYRGRMTASSLHLDGSLLQKKNKTNYYKSSDMQHKKGSNLVNRSVFGSVPECGMEFRTLSIPPLHNPTS